jgi:hypothetical protein
MEIFKKSFLIGSKTWCNFVTHLNNLGSMLAHTTIDDKLLYKFGIV